MSVCVCGISICMFMLCFLLLLLPAATFASVSVFMFYMGVCVYSCVCMDFFGKIIV